MNSAATSANSPTLSLPARGPKAWLPRLERKAERASCPPISPAAPAGRSRVARPGPEGLPRRFSSYTLPADTAELPSGVTFHELTESG